MFCIPDGLLFQAELVLTDRWQHGPLELIFIDRPDSLEERYALTDWNLHHRGGFIRSGETFDHVLKAVPALDSIKNPNVFLVPRVDGYTELHAMLASVVPEAILKRNGIERRRANFYLAAMVSADEDIRTYPHAATKAFEEYVWTKIARQRRLKSEFFASDSPLRLLAADHGFWMSRLYRIAIDIRESFEECEDEEEWRPIERLRAEARSMLPEEMWDRFYVGRPLKGGDLWDMDDPEDREAVVHEALTGGEVIESLDPVLDVLHSDRTHDDFSERYSWVKEDFERSFYSKRSKIRVSLLETMDDFPVWSASDQPAGYANVLFRDLLSFFNRRERHLILAIRHGKTVSEIATELGHKGHAAVSRRVKALNERVRRYLLD